MPICLSKTLRRYQDLSTQVTEPLKNLEGWTMNFESNEFSISDLTESELQHFLPTKVKRKP